LDWEMKTNAITRLGIGFSDQTGKTQVTTAQTKESDGETTGGEKKGEAEKSAAYEG